MIEIELTDEDNGWRSFNKMTVKHNGVVVREETDGGEPEDQSFGRDWRWVPSAIREAYELGLKDGAK